MTELITCNEHSIFFHLQMLVLTPDLDVYMEGVVACLATSPMLLFRSFQSPDSILVSISSVVREYNVERRPSRSSISQFAQAQEGFPFCMLLTIAAARDAQIAPAAHDVFRLGFRFRI